MERLLNQKMIAEEVEEDYDPFKRLPEEIIISHIFNQIPEAKSLLRISLVSKYFSHLAYKTHSVSVKIPMCFSPEKFADFERSLKLESLSFPGKALYLIATAPLRLFRSIKKRLHPLPSSDEDRELYLVQVTNFLQKFTSMRSLYLEYDYPKYNLLEHEPIIKWKMGCKCDCFLFLITGSLENLATDCDSLTEDPVDDDHMLPTEFIQWLFDLFHDHMVTALGRLSMLNNLVPSLNESLRNVTVTDSKKRGLIDLGEDNLVELRKQNDGDLGSAKVARLRIWHSKSLKLPLSRCVMQWVTLYLFQVKESHENQNDDFAIAKQVFDEEEVKVFAEAAIKMLDKEAILDKRCWLNLDSISVSKGQILSPRPPGQGDQDI